MLKAINKIIKKYKFLKLLNKAFKMRKNINK